MYAQDGAYERCVVIVVLAIVVSAASIAQPLTLPLSQLID